MATSTPQWPPASPAVHQFLTAALSHRGPAALPYADDARWTIHHHLAALSHAFPSLRLDAGSFTHNDGRAAFLLRAEGPLPLAAASSAVAGIHVTMWLLEDYPCAPPAVFLTFPPGTAVKRRHPLVDPCGAVSVPYLREWLFPYHNLVDLAGSLARLFSQDPPFAASPRDLTADVAKKALLDLEGIQQSTALETESLLATQTLLRQRREELRRGSRELEAELELLEEQLQMVRMNTDVLASWRPPSARPEGKNIDEVLVAADPQSRRALECTAADMAADDVMYALDEALREGRVAIADYLKSVRAAAREQFFHRAMAMNSAV
ncbi:protein ELC-like [Zingiber officinale]|uniref:protein ELC-like n=1 Tax=Zingiber officinale TaxID=94328 RepID=UPI001C4C427A|nr:protein ELC-like [Zingiber officinale]